MQELFKFHYLSVLKKSVLKMAEGGFMWPPTNPVPKIAEPKPGPAPQTSLLFM